MHQLKLMVLLSFFVFIIPISWASEDWSDKPIIDEEYRVYEQEIDRVTDECMRSTKNIMRKLKCGNELREKYQKEGKLRGTDEYCKKHYGHLGFKDLGNTLKKLKNQRRIARIRLKDSIPGEVTEEMFMVEEFWVESRLAKLQKERTVKTEKKVYQKSE